MTTLADMPFDDLQAGMKFKHPEHGEQIVLDLGQGPLGPAIRFHDSEVYNGEMPRLGEEEGEETIFEFIARRTYSHGAEDWEYLGMVAPEEVAAHGWQWLQTACPHCGFVHRLLASGSSSGARQCRACGMVFYRPLEPVTDDAACREARWGEG